MEDASDQVLFILDHEAFEAFTALLEEPPTPNDGLERLLAVRPPWDAEPT